MPRFTKIALAATLAGLLLSATLISSSSAVTATAGKPGSSCKNPLKAVYRPLVDDPDGIVASHMLVRLKLETTGELNAIGMYAYPRDKIHICKLVVRRRNKKSLVKVSRSVNSLLIAKLPKNTNKKNVLAVEAYGAFRGLSCSLPFRVSYDGEFTGGDMRYIKLRHESVREKGKTTQISFRWVPRRGTVICKAVFAVKSGPTYVSRNKRGGSFTHKWPQYPLGTPFKLQQSFKSMYVTARYKRR